MGMIGMAFGLGFIFGPAVGGALASVPIAGRTGALPCFIAAGLSVAEPRLGELRPARVAPAGAPVDGKRSLAPLNFAAARDAFARPGIALAVLVNFVLILSFTVLDQTFRFFTEDNFKMTALETGSSSASSAWSRRSCRAGIIRPLAKRFDESVADPRGHGHPGARVRGARGVAVVRTHRALCGLRAPRARQRPHAAERLGVHVEARRPARRKAERSARTSRRRASRACSVRRSAASSTARSARARRTSPARSAWCSRRAWRSSSCRTRSARARRLSGTRAPIRRRARASTRRPRSRASRR